MLYLSISDVKFIYTRYLSDNSPEVSRKFSGSFPEVEGRYVAHPPQFYSIPLVTRYEVWQSRGKKQKGGQLLYFIILSSKQNGRDSRKVISRYTYCKIGCLECNKSYISLYLLQDMRFGKVVARIRGGVNSYIPLYLVQNRTVGIQEKLYSVILIAR